MILPTIHSNGTGRADLVNGYHAASKAIADAMDALRAIEFNSLDYYVQGPLAWANAVDEMEERHKALKAMKSELDEITLHCLESKLK